MVSRLGAANDTFGGVVKEDERVPHMEILDQTD